MCEARWRCAGEEKDITAFGDRQERYRGGEREVQSGEVVDNSYEQARMETGEVSARTGMRS
jgi:hypothetical protein